MTKLLKEEKFIEEEGASDHRGPATYAPTGFPSFPERIATPAPSPDPNMDDPCALIGEQSCDTVSTICFEDTRRVLIADITSVTDAADYYNSRGEKIEGDDDFQQFLLANPAESNKLYKAQETKKKRTFPTFAPTDTTGVTRIHTEGEKSANSVAAGIFAKRHRAVLNTATPTFAPSIVLAPQNPTPPPTPEPTVPAGPEFVDSFHCACRSGFVKDPLNNTHCFPEVFKLEVAAAADEGGSFGGSYGSEEADYIEEGTVTNGPWFQDAVTPLPVIALFCLFAAPFGVVIVHKRRAAAHSLGSQGASGALEEGSTPAADGPAGIVGYGRGGRGDGMHAAGSNAAGSIDMGMVGPARGPSVREEAVHSAAHTAGHTAAHTATHTHAAIAATASPALKPQTTKWLVKGDKYHSTSI
jgi:hypothetical protein